VKRLSEWVADLDTKLAAGEYDAVSHGVDEWYVEYNALNRSLHEVIEANERVNQRRTDLVQRLAKATADYEAHKAKIGESKSLATFARIAKESLTGKIKLDEAERAVESYEIKLAQLIANIGKA
jgi:regulator of replication initiation timing